MPAIVLNGDIVGGSAIATESSVYINGKNVVCVGDSITPHGDGGHSGAVMVQGSSTVFIGGKAVCRSGDAASCGHTAISSYTQVVIG
jgi:uncharacterized Zn-binding protein involved in type VI secretion